MTLQKTEEKRLSSDADGTILVRDLAVSFAHRNGTVYALHPTSLSLEPGTSTAIIGESGCGKSVLLMGMLGFLDRTAHVSGSVQYRGEELKALKGARKRGILRDRLALIPQNPPESLNRRMVIVDQLAEGVTGNRRRRRELVASELRRLGLEHVTSRSQTHRYSFQLSGGMQQRALVAAATARSPEWLIADEPTTGLDAINRADCAKLLAEAKQSVVGGLIVVTHDLHLAESLADRIVVMYAGRIVEDAPAKEFFRSPNHPYSRGLLKAVPSRGAIPIPGESPASSELHDGCPFAPRCIHSHERCTAELPRMYAARGAAGDNQMGDHQTIDRYMSDRHGHVRCFLYADD